MNIRMLVITHKQYDMPKDPMYLPVCVGKGKDHLPYQRDDDGENIADKNYSYCELTGIYWAWKNLSADAVGVCHYRRYFSNAEKNRPVVKAEAEKCLDKYDVVVTPKRTYHFYTMESHYVRSVRGYAKIHANDIKMLRCAVADVDAGYSPDLEKVLRGNRAHMLNMFLMKKPLFDQYCAWMFRVVDRACELLADREDQWRFAGALSELLLDVWLEHNRIIYGEMPIYEKEKQPFVKRLYFFIRRKLIRPQGGKGK